MEKTGKVKWFNVQKGYGFITDSEGNDVFVHHTGITNGRNYIGLDSNDEVTFEVSDGKKGPEASAVSLTKKATKSPESSK